MLKAEMEEEKEGENNVGRRVSSSLRMSIGSESSRRSWVAASVLDTWSNHGGVFERSMRYREDEDEQELKWAAIERLPTFERVRTSMMKKKMKKELYVLEDFETNGFDYEQVDVTKLGIEEKRHLLDCILKNIEEDNLKFLQGLRNRIDK